MNEKFEIKGEWFLPGSRDTSVHGILIFDPQEGANLEVFGNLEGQRFYTGLKDQEIILGLSSDSKQITLYDCFMTRAGGPKLIQGQESGKPSSSYSIKFILEGIHAKTTDDLKFNQISSEIFNLGEWVGISGFDYKLPELDELKKKRNHDWIQAS